MRTVYIQTDQAKPDMGFIIQPLKANLAARGYKMVETPGEAAHTIHVGLNFFDMRNRLNIKKGPQVAPAVGPAAGTAVGGAVAGNTLHAATTDLGAAGGVVSLVGVKVVTSALSVPKDKLFFGAVDVKIRDAASGQQHTVVNTNVQADNPNDPAVRRGMIQLAADDLAAKIAALMP